MNKEENISQDRYDGAMYLVEGILDSLGIGGEGIYTAFFGEEMTRVAIHFFYVKSESKDYIPYEYGFNKEGALCLTLQIYDGMMNKGYKHIRSEVERCIFGILHLLR
jgi:hypothetical protein